MSSEVYLSKRIHTLTHPILHLRKLALNGAHLNSFSVSSDPLEIRPELTIDYSLDNPSNSYVRISGVLKVGRLR